MEGWEPPCYCGILAEVDAYLSFVRNKTTSKLTIRASVLLSEITNADQ